MVKPKEEITQAELLGIIREMVDKWGSQKELADHLGISNAYLSDIIRGNQAISSSVAKRLGYKRVVKFIAEE
jgi:plasmid maintenance system antidote protein VapI